jgi:hypothetical protein
MGILLPLRQCKLRHRLQHRLHPPRRLRERLCRRKSFAPASADKQANHSAGAAYLPSIT